MVTRGLAVTVGTLLCLFAARAADIDGTIVIKRKLTKRKVTAAAGSYDRGVNVELGADKEEDPLVFERGRVAVYLEGDQSADPVTAVMEQKNRRFVPDTLVIPAGSSVSFPNLDPIFHNVFSLSKPKSFDLGNYSKDHARTVTFAKPGIVFVNCHLHPNMAAAIVVAPNRWCAKADGAGHFSLSGVPPGSYTIVAWHRAAGYFRRTIKISEGRVSPVQFFIPLDATGAPDVMAQR
jgi:plastocyanin